jgi:hypothetical protein
MWLTLGKIAFSLTPEMKPGTHKAATLFLPFCALTDTNLGAVLRIAQLAS